MDFWRGIKQKDYQKQLEDQKKAKQDQLEIDQKYTDNVLELERSLQASKISIMKEGADRQEGEAEAAFQQEIDNINSKEKDFKAAFEGKYGTSDFTKMSKEQAEEMSAALESFDQLRINAEKEKNNKIREINSDTAGKIKAIWSDVNEAFMSDTEKEVQAINEKYDALIKRAKEAGETNFDNINKARNKEIDEAYIETGLKRLDWLCSWKNSCR